MPTAIERARTLVEISQALSDAVQELSFGPPVTHVYNPLRYAWSPHRNFVERWGDRVGPREVVFLGMNPGPWGMAQTGVPFGEVALARDWLDVAGHVDRPPAEHPKRPILGFASPRSEVSGRRLWGWARDRFGTPEAFFERFYVANYCPLVFMRESGRNHTPDKLPVSERGPLEAACDAALRRTVQLLRPSLVVGVGAFAEGRAKRALDGVGVRIGRVLHPSPASPAANRGWEAAAERDLRSLGLLHRT